MASEDPVRVVVAENHDFFRKGLLQALEKREDVEVVGAGRDGRQALALIRAERPDVALVDMQMPGLDGLGVLRAVREEGLPAHVVFLSAFGEPALVGEAIDAGASGYVSKDDDEDSICEAVLKAADGEIPISSDLHVGLIEHLRRRTEADAALSPREREILARIAKGETGREIGRELHLSPETIKTYTRRLYEKLGARSRATAVAEASRRGLLR